MKLYKMLTGLVFAVILIFPSASRAAHPLITDDTGTQGKGKFQLELNGQSNSDNENINGVANNSTGWQASAILSYGIIDNIDLVLTVPYLWGRVEENGLATYDEKGVSDTTLEAKWRFFEKGGYSLALKPGIRFPTGNDEKGLGAGRVGGQIYLIGSKELGPWAFHANLGYIRNENKVNERYNLWNASLATTWEVIKNLKLVANIGAERNADENAKDDPAFLIGGVIYTVVPNVDLDCGVKYGLTSSEVDFSLLAGITIRF